MTPTSRIKSCAAGSGDLAAAAKYASEKSVASASDLGMNTRHSLDAWQKFEAGELARRRDARSGASVLFTVPLESNHEETLAAFGKVMARHAPGCPWTAEIHPPPARDARARKSPHTVREDEEGRNVHLHAVIGYRDKDGRKLRPPMGWFDSVRRDYYQEINGALIARGITDDRILADPRSMAEQAEKDGGQQYEAEAHEGRGSSAAPLRASNREVRARNMDRLRLVLLKLAEQGPDRIRQRARREGVILGIDEKGAVTIRRRGARKKYSVAELFADSPARGEVLKTCKAIQKEDRTKTAAREKLIEHVEALRLGSPESAYKEGLRGSFDRQGRRTFWIKGTKARILAPDSCQQLHASLDFIQTTRKEQFEAQQDYKKRLVGALFSGAISGRAVEITKNGKTSRLIVIEDQAGATFIDADTSGLGAKFEALKLAQGRQAAAKSSPKTKQAKNNEGQKAPREKSRPSYEGPGRLREGAQEWERVLHRWRIEAEKERQEKKRDEDRMFDELAESANQQIGQLQKRAAEAVREEERDWFAAETQAARDRRDRARARGGMSR